METKAIVVKRHFEASAERVFDAWVDPQRAGRWLFASPTGEIVRVEIDARVGGGFLITRRDGDVDIEHVGKYLEMERPGKLVFEFSVPRFSKEITVVCVEIVSGGKGCDLTLTHTGVLPEWVERTTEGWGKILEGLNEKIES